MFRLAAQRSGIIEGTCINASFITSLVFINTIQACIFYDFHPAYLHLDREDNWSRQSSHNLRCVEYCTSPSSITGGLQLDHIFCSKYFTLHTHTR